MTMATYTMTVSEVMENLFNPSMDRSEYEIEYEEFEVNGVKYGSLPVIPDPKKLGLGTYPLFNEAYRPILNGKIIDQYFHREIGVETIDEWRMVMRRKMDQIMPYYNKIYESELIEFNPLITMDITTSGTTTSNETGAVTAETVTDSTSSSSSRAVQSETPQTMLSGNGDYATSAADSNGTTNVGGTNSQESNSTSNNEINNQNNVKGFQGIASEMIVRYRNSLLNIDTQILNDIEDCFMLVLNNGDAYSQTRWY